MPTEPASICLVYERLGTSTKEWTIVLLIIIMIPRFDRYSRKMEMHLNVHKSRVVVYSREGFLKELFLWTGESLEEAKCFTNLGFVSSNDGILESRLEHLGTVASSKIWKNVECGQRCFENIFKARCQLFDSAIRSGMVYGAEFETLEKVHRKKYK